MSGFRVLLATHGDLADALYRTACRILGRELRCRVVGVPFDAHAEEVLAKLEEAVAEEQGSGPLLILTDMFGGTSTNIGIAHLKPCEVEVVTGVNLPMILKTASLVATGDGNMTLASLAIAVRDQGRRSIEVASRLIGSEEDR